jgi:hypothetical protein
MTSWQPPGMTPGSGKAGDEPGLSRSVTVDPQEAADLFRAQVADQLALLVVESEITGSPGLISVRVREVIEARADGDGFAVRAAVMNLAVASAVYVVQIDMDLQGRSWR